MGLRRGRIVQTDADAFLAALPAFGIRMVDPLSYDSVFQLARLHGLTVYDASYLDLALRERLTLASLDAALIRAAQDSGVAVFQP